MAAWVDPCGPFGPAPEPLAGPFTSAVCSLLWQSVHSMVESTVSPPRRALARFVERFLPGAATGWKLLLPGSKSVRLLLVPGRAAL